jgi:uncharacterized damage-inducible protein DinB
MIPYSIRTLNQLADLIKTLNPKQYSSNLDLLSNNSIGKHTRHIIEFYQCVFDGLKNGIVNYDKRERNLLLETDQEYALDAIAKIISTIQSRQSDQQVFLQISFSDVNEITEMQSTYFRELAYNIEHTVHHLAIIKIAVTTNYREIRLPEQFGVAHSTQIYSRLQK